MYPTKKKWPPNIVVMLIINSPATVAKGKLNAIAVNSNDTRLSAGVVDRTSTLSLQCWFSLLFFFSGGRGEGGTSRSLDRICHMRPRTFDRFSILVNFITHKDIYCVCPSARAPGRVLKRSRARVCVCVWARASVLMRLSQYFFGTSWNILNSLSLCLPACLSPPPPPSPT